MIEENNQFTFFKKYSKIILVCFLCFALGGFFLQKKMSSHKLEEKHDCLRAQNIFTELQMGKALSNETLEEIHSIVKRRPYLLPKYEQLIGMALLAQHQNEKAIDHLSNSIKRDAQEETQKFSKLSLLVAEKQYAQALEQAKELNIRLEKDDEYPALYAFNLLRTLFLAYETEDLLLANVTWQKLLAHPLWPQLEPLFQEGELTLQDYLNSPY